MEERHAGPTPAAPSPPASSGEPIFIRGIAPRSGTNHLMNLLCLHPDCGPPAPIWEDHLVTHARHLDAYAQALWRSWSPEWGVDPANRDRLRGALGDGLTDFLRGLAKSPRVVTKTPSVAGLDALPALFPRASLLLLVRDGRAVVESGSRSFGWYRDGAMHDWRNAGRAILDFDAAHRGGPFRYRIVRYENLVAQPEKTLTEIFEFAELDPARCDFEAVGALPVHGSSDLARSGGRVDWEGRAATRDFDPLARSRSWSRWQHARFDWVAGDTARALGYADAGKAGAGAADVAFNTLLDLRHGLLSCGIPLWRALRRRHGRRVAAGGD